MAKKKEEQVSDQDVRQATQQAGQQRADLASSEVRIDDVGQAERNKVAGNDRSDAGFQQQSRLLSGAQNYAELTYATSLGLVNQLNQASVDLVRMINGNLVEKQRNAITIDLALKKQMVRHEGVAADAEVETPSEGAAEGHVLKTASLDTAALAAIQAMVPGIVAATLKEMGVTAAK